MTKDDLKKYEAWVKRLGVRGVCVLAPSTLEYGKTILEPNERLQALRNFLQSQKKFLQGGNQFSLASLQKSYHTFAGVSIDLAKEVVSVRNVCDLMKLVALTARPGDCIPIPAIDGNDTPLVAIGVVSEGEKTLPFTPKESDPFSLETELKKLCRKAKAIGYGDENIKEILGSIAENGWAE
jgi:hypothetical protein